MNNIVLLADWDPTMNSRGTRETPSPRCLQTVRKDIMAVIADPPTGIVIAPDESDMTVIHCLLTGPSDTPYEGGFFYFLLRCPADYPMRPPKVRLMTTGEGKVRFNPNLYSTGKVCLSILGTWNGPAWSPAQNLWSVLISIQSIMNNAPYFNEPGYVKEKTQGVSLLYNDIITHETIKVAVCDMLESSTCDSRNMPKTLRESMEQLFIQHYSYYISCCRKNIGIVRRPTQDPFSNRKIVFNFETSLQRLQAIREKLTEKPIDVNKTESSKSENDLSELADSDFFLYSSGSSDSD